MKYEQLAKDIIKNVGGKENIRKVVHCITRLRFQLKDEGKANTDVLKEMDGVVTVMKSGGQYQVVIGNHVPDVYKAVLAEAGLQAQDPVEEDGPKEKKGLLNGFIDIVSNIFMPVLGVLAAAGMIKGFNALFIAVDWLEDTSGTYHILNAVGDSLFHFFPIFLGYTAMTKFGGNKFIGMAIGAALVYPSLSTLTAGDPLYTLFTGTMFESPVHITFLGIPVILMSYASSVIPIILATYFAAKIEKWFQKITPDVVKLFVVPFATLLVIVPVTFIVIGPIATWAGQILGQATIGAYNLSPIVAGAILGGLWQVIVIFGLHWGIVPVAINNIMTLGADPILAMIFAPSFAQIGAVLAVWMKTKQQKLKALSIPAFISGVFGVTEPAIYGVTLPLKKPFIMSCIAAAVGGAIVGITSTHGYLLGGLGIFAIPSFIHPTEGLTIGFWGAIIAMVVAFVLGFVLTYLFGMGKGKKTEAVEETVVAKTADRKEGIGKVGNEVISSPFNGQVVHLSEIKDAAFASGALGAGVAIVPSEGKLFSPISGTVTALFPTKHAIGIVADNGAEMLIHIGLDTVQLEGKHFTAHIAQGDRVKKGQLLIEFDIEQIKAAGFDVATPIIVTNHERYTLVPTAERQIKSGHALLELQAK